VKKVGTKRASFGQWGGEPETGWHIDMRKPQFFEQGTRLAPGEKIIAVLLWKNGYN